MTFIDIVSCIVEKTKSGKLSEVLTVILITLLTSSIWSTVCRVVNVRETVSVVVPLSTVF